MKLLDSRILEQQIHAPWYEERNNENLAIILSRGYAKPGNRVLEIGIGSGLMLQRFAEAGFVATGVCKSRVDYDRCRQQGLDVYLCDMSNMPFEDKVFDFIYTRNTFDHSLMPAITLSEFSRVLASTGIMFIEFEWYNKDDVNKHRSIRRVHPVVGDGSYDKHRHWSAMTHDQMTWLVRRLDLELVDSFFAYESQAFIVRNSGDSGGEAVELDEWGRISGKASSQNSANLSSGNVYRGKWLWNYILGRRV